MSITFFTNAPSNETTKEDACLCAQSAPLWAWDEAMHGNMTPEVRACMAENASKECKFCHGSGIDTVPTDDGIKINLSNDNAFQVMRALGLKPDYCGEITFPDFKRAYMRAMNTDLSRFAREPEQQDVVITTQEEGSNVVTMEKRTKFFDMGVDVDYIKSTIERLMSLTKTNGTTIYWD